MKEKVFLKRSEDYSPLHPKADPLTGILKLWYAYNEEGVAVTWAITKKAAIEEAKHCGYAITSKNPFEV